MSKRTKVASGVTLIVAAVLLAVSVPSWAGTPIDTGGAIVLAVVAPGLLVWGITRTI